MARELLRYLGRHATNELITCCYNHLIPPAQQGTPHLRRAATHSQHYRNLPLMARCRPPSVSNFVQRRPLPLAQTSMVVAHSDREVVACVHTWLFDVSTAGCLFTIVCSTELIPARTEVGPGTLRTAAQVSCAKRTLAKTQQVFTNDKTPALLTRRSKAKESRPLLTIRSLEPNHKCLLALSTIACSNFQLDPSTFDQAHR